MSYIFISYSHKDKDYAHKLHQHLFEHGFNAWIDDRIDYGSSWPDEVEKRVREFGIRFKKAKQILLLNLNLFVCV
jgi:hypothetical protein